MTGKRHDPHGAQLDCLLHHELHLVRFQQAGSQHDGRRRLRISCEPLDEPQRHCRGTEAHHLHARHSPFIIDDDDLIAGLRTHHMHQMMRIAAGDLDCIREAPFIEKPPHISVSRQSTSDVQPLR